MKKRKLNENGQECWKINMKALRRVKKSIHLNCEEIFGYKVYEINCSEGKTGIVTPLFIIGELKQAQDIVRAMRLKVFRLLYPRKVRKSQIIQKPKEIIV